MVTHPDINPIPQGLTTMNRREPVFPFGDSRTYVDHEELPGNTQTHSSQASKERSGIFQAYSMVDSTIKTVARSNLKKNAMNGLKMPLDWLTRLALKCKHHESLGARYTETIRLVP